MMFWRLGSTLDKVHSKIHPPAAASQRSPSSLVPHLTKYVNFQVKMRSVSIALLPREEYNTNNKQHPEHSSESF